MKQLFVVLLMITGFALPSFAQLGKMQFQDAEEQFTAGKYKEALELLDKSEKSLGKTNPHIEHLRVQARLEFIKQDLSANFDHISIAKKEANTFLTKYNGIASLEDKYREIYKSLKELEAMPDRKGIEKLAEDKKAAGLAAIDLQKVISWAEQKAVSYGWKPDQSEFAFKNYNSAINSYKWSRYIYKGGVLVGRDVGSPMSAGGYISEGPSSYFINEEKIVTGYINTTHKGKNVADDFNAKFEVLKNELKSQAGSMGSLVTEGSKGGATWVMLAVPVSAGKPAEIAYYIRYTVSHMQKWSSIAITFHKEQQTPLWL